MICEEVHGLWQVQRFRVAGVDWVSPDGDSTPANMCTLISSQLFLRPGCQKGIA